MTNLPQLEEKIYSLVPELKYSIVNQGIYGHFPIEIKHWLPLLESCRLYYTGYIEKYNSYGESLSGNRYDFKKPLESQSPEFRQFLFENIQ